jgi:hypothetical protein
MNSMSLYQLFGVLILVICCNCNGQHSFQDSSKIKNMDERNINIDVDIEKNNDSLVIRYFVENKEKYDF